MVPATFGRYFEPFVGSGALFFDLQPSSAVLGDALLPLVETYRSVQTEPHAVHEAILQWQVSSDAYYAVRALDPSTAAERAAKFIYLNKTAWNGLYRVNRAGGFNVPYGLPKSSNIVSLESLLECSDALGAATLKCADFEESLAGAEQGDLVFVDPPYTTSHKDNGFLHYNETLFSWDDQRRLAALCLRLATDGVHVIVTNADHPSLRELYSEFHIEEYWRKSTLAGSAKHRRLVSELILTSTEAK